MQLQYVRDLITDTWSRVASTTASADIGFAGISLDILIIVVANVAVLAYALTRGKKRVLASVNALIATLALFFVFPYWDFIIAPETSAQNALMIQAASFAGIFVVLRYIARRMTYGSYPDDTLPRWLEAGGLSFTAVGVTIAAFYRLFPLAEIYVFGTPFDSVFMHQQALFWWLAAMVGMLYIGIRK